MRKIHLIVSAAKGALPVLLAASVAPMAATCTTSPPTNTAAVSVGAGGDGGSGGASQSSSSGFGGEIIFPDGGTAGSAGASNCPDPFSVQTTFTVEVPPEGTPAEPGQICAIAMDPVTSNFAAKVTLVKSPNGDHLATGHIAIDAAVQADMMGLPSIEITAADPALAAAKITNIVPEPGGWSFDLEWPMPFNVQPYSWERITFKVRMLMRCDPQAMVMRLVESTTYVNLCVDMGSLTWVSSGEVCNACDIIAEMAPSPIVSDKHFDELPLGHVMRLRVVPVARIGASVVLFAENDGGENLVYDWHPSAGKLEKVSDDIAVWTPPSDLLPHIVQVAVHGEDTAAVATYAWREPQ